jgi:hypothetical protein
LGVFLFWIIWPSIVARQTEKHYLKYTGKEMPKDRIVKLRKDLEQIKGELSEVRKA